MYLQLKAFLHEADAEYKKIRGVSLDFDMDWKLWLHCFKEIDKKLGVGCKDCLVQSWFNNQLNDAAGTIETGVENSFR